MPVLGSGGRTEGGAAAAKHALQELSCGLEVYRDVLLLNVSQRAAHRHKAGARVRLQQVLLWREDVKRSGCVQWPHLLGNASSQDTATSLEKARHCLPTVRLVPHR